MSDIVLTPDSLLFVSLEILVSLGLTLAVMPRLIQYLHTLKFGQTEREEGLESHKFKTGTPTMGGLVFILVPLVVYAVFSLFSPFGWNMNTAILWISFVGYGLIGFLDDYIIVVKKDNTGLKPAVKFGLQSILAVIVFFMYQSVNGTEIILPVLHTAIPLGWLYFAVVFFMFTGSSNAVNLTDGVDGLCAGLVAIALIPFTVFALWQNMQDVAVVALVIQASLLGYLKFNVSPAKVFMGDTGSLALGGLLAALAMVLKQELLFIVIAAVFIAETLSVMIQVSHYKRTHKRIFLMAPLHHHYEKKGWSENQVVQTFWVWGVVFAVLGLLLGAL